MFVEQETPRIFLPYTSRKKSTGENVIIQTTIIIITKFTIVDYNIKCASHKLHLKYNIVTPPVSLPLFSHIHIRMLLQLKLKL